MIKNKLVKLAGIAAVTLAFTAGLCFTGCSKKTADADTMGTKLAEEFKTQIKQTKDLTQIAESLGELSEMFCVVEPMEPGYFPGFDSEVSGFTQAVGFFPMIGSIPFVGYIFEAENAKTFAENLKQQANPRWNICTEAAETVVEVSGKYVFFTMCPGDEEEEW